MPWQEADNIEKVLGGFDEWLRFFVSDYIKEKQAPDLWALLDEYRPIIDDATINREDTSNFRNDEKPEIRQSIAQFRSSVVSSFDPSTDQVQFIDEKLDYLSRAVDRLNRLDWRALAVSSVISIAVNLSADTERGRLLFHLFQDAFRSTLKLLQ